MQQPEALRTGRPVNNRLQNRTRQQTSTQRHAIARLSREPSPTIGKEIATGVCRKSASCTCHTQPIYKQSLDKQPQEENKKQRKNTRLRGSTEAQNTETKVK